MNHQPLLDAIARFDDGVDERWATIRGHRVTDRLFYTASGAGDHSVLWHTLGVIQAIKKDNLSAALRFSTALWVESVLVNGLIKSMFKRSRPTPGGPESYNLRRPKTTSFPSGHASAALTAAAMLSRQGKAPLWYGLAAIVAASRIHVRIHHASDVVAGALTGALLGQVIRRFANRVQRRRFA